MRLSKVFARFYKSFNIDHIRKATPGAKPHGGWEMFDGGWHPYVEVSIDPTITAVVGANESGKSQLVNAIRRAITGEDIEPLDLCRYCDFFGVETGRRFWPHLGLGWSAVQPEEADRLRTALGVPGGAFETFLMFRQEPGEVRFWFPDGAGWTEHVVSADLVAGLVGVILPNPVVVDPNAALPDTVPLVWLADESHPDVGSNRMERSALVTTAAGLRPYMSNDAATFATHAPTIFSLLKPFLDSAERGDPKVKAQELRLARELLFDLAQIDPLRFHDLQQAIANSKDGYANGLVDSMNEQLAKRLNLPKWWVQDRDFTLCLSAREHDLVFTIRDRTGREYTFAERSSGLKYFLSYLIQCQALRRSGDRPRILLMDEPDAHLSAEAQQDLLRIFDDLVTREAGQSATQIVYVTHSPFLLDKNHAERLRVVEKGTGLDGTRVIRNAAQNHYEPLRSAFGAFVGESAFVGSVNLLVEGQADQILLAGAARAIRRRAPGVENDTLDLNRLVIVPCNGASQVPYMVYLIRGRDVDKPPVVVLLDADREGLDAAKVMQEDAKFRALISRKFVLSIANQISDMGAGTVEELEDLIPIPLAIRAANAALEEAHEFRAGEIKRLVPADLVATKKARLFDQVELASSRSGRTIGKVGFARALVNLVADSDTATSIEGVDLWLKRMAQVNRAINIARLQAQAAAAKTRLANRVAARVQMFVTDHPERARREEVANLLLEIESQLDGSNEADAIQQAMHELRRSFALAEDPAAYISDHAGLTTALGNLRFAFQTRRAALPTQAGETVVPPTPARTRRAGSKARGTVKAVGDAG